MQHPALPRRHLDRPRRAARAIAQTKMTISQRAEVDGVLCDVVCTGRFYDFLEKRDGRWGLVLRQPIYEKDRLDPVDPAARSTLDPSVARALSRPATATSPTCRPGIGFDGQARHARADGPGGRGALRARHGLARRRISLTRTRPPTGRSRSPISCKKGTARGRASSGILRAIEGSAQSGIRDLAGKNAQATPSSSSA